MRKLLPEPRSTSGFTIIELMIVMTVIAILAGMALFGLGKAQQQARDSQRIQTLTGVQSLLERYYGDNQTYPSGGFCSMLSTLSGGNYIASNPNDPSTKGDVCACSKDGNSNPTCNGAKYSYSGGGDSYSMQLTKESGGTTQPLTNPN